MAKIDRRIRIALVLSFAAALLTGAVYYAPRFLVYADKPVQTDAVVLFVGNDGFARQNEAHRLLEEGYARFLIVPAYHQVFMRGNVPYYAGSSGNRQSGGSKEYPGFYEKTHLEALEAKKIMDSMGLRSAAMVSSSYHLRRIHMISNVVFGEQARQFAYIPGRSVRNPIALSEMGLADWKFVVREYVKICWFRLYAPFIGKR